MEGHIAINSPKPLTLPRDETRLPSIRTTGELLAVPTRTPLRCREPSAARGHVLGKGRGRGRGAYLLSDANGLHGSRVLQLQQHVFSIEPGFLVRVGLDASNEPVRRCVNFGL